MMEADMEEKVVSWFRSLYQAIRNATPQRRHPFVDYIDMATQAQTDPQFQRSAEAVAAIVRLGFPLSQSMEMLPNVFHDKHIAVVRYGEMYGELDLTLERYVERPEERFPRCASPESL